MVSNGDKCFERSLCWFFLNWRHGFTFLSTYTIYNLFGLVWHLVKVLMRTKAFIESKNSFYFFFKIRKKMQCNDHILYLLDNYVVSSTTRASLNRIQNEICTMLLSFLRYKMAIDSGIEDKPDIYYNAAIHQKPFSTKE